jgi:hypothetical protein
MSESNEVEKLALDIVMAIGKYVKGMVDRGFELPMHVCQMTRDGSFVFAQYFKNEQTGKLDGRTLAKHWPQGTEPFPMYFLYIDRTGKPELAVLAARGEMTPVVPGSSQIH